MVHKPICSALAPHFHTQRTQAPLSGWGSPSFRALSGTVFHRESDPLLDPPFLSKVSPHHVTAHTPPPAHAPPSPSRHTRPFKSIFWKLKVGGPT